MNYIEQKYLKKHTLVFYMSEDNKDIFIKIDNIQKTETEKNPKKRGRKPKPKQDIPVKTVHKKRGRKPKLHPNIDNNKINIKESQNIILHLNIKETDIQNKQIDPLETNIIYHEFTKESNNNNTTEINKDKYNNYIENIINERNDIVNNNKLLFIEFSNSNKTKKWPSKTNIDCMWDCHPFVTEPFGIPIKKFNHILYMFGNFCSPECAAAYNFSMDDENIWERYSLLNEIYSQCNPINIASTKLLLSKFGGIYSIKEYRFKNINNQIILNLMPIISYIPQIEEVSYNYNTKTNTNNLQLNNNSYNLKREKCILNNKNTLKNIMNLKYI